MNDEGNLDTVEYALINLVRSYPELYDPEDSFYRDKTKRTQSWTEIAKQLNKDESWCHTKWKHLTDYYRRRKKTYENSANPVNPARRWVYFDAMSFLDLTESNQDELNLNHQETSLSSIKSSSEVNFDGESSHRNYFDETQYQSLDGIEERATLAPRLGSLKETDPLSDDYPPTKRQKRQVITMDNGSYSRAHPTLSNEVPYPQGPTVASSTSVAETRSTSLVNNDCPHYHFCMSLATRFKKMDQARATYMQMKIMELFLKSEFPEDYDRLKDKS